MKTLKEYKALIQISAFALIYTTEIVMITKALVA